ncbi:hypothetical protein Sjap_003527 [Stephania japonica]|uniref:Uncharacterized protein n=1 Tax=Stephania japonica TaxID=461633 RepID=A0AAP0KR05_9MAGN
MILSGPIRKTIVQKSQRRANMYVNTSERQKSKSRENGREQIHACNNGHTYIGINVSYK